MLCNADTCLESTSWYKRPSTEKGKPVERQGRKATGLRVVPKTAEPPEKHPVRQTCRNRSRAAPVLTIIIEPTPLN